METMSRLLDLYKKREKIPEAALGAGLQIVEGAQSLASHYWAKPMAEAGVPRDKDVQAMLQDLRELEALAEDFLAKIRG